MHFSEKPCLGTEPEKRTGDEINERERLREDHLSEK